MVDDTAMGSAKKKNGGKRKPMILEPVLKELLVDIEISGKTWEEFNLAGLCNSKRYIYGGEATKMRRDIGQTFANIKRKDPLSYQHYLDNHGVPSGEALNRQIRILMGDEDSLSSSAKSASDTDSEGDDNSLVSSVESSAKKSKKSKTIKKSTRSTKSKGSKKTRKSRNSKAESFYTPAEPQPIIDKGKHALKNWKCVYLL